MKFKEGAQIVVKNVYSGGNFEDGDIVTVTQIGCEEDPNCYGAISPHDGMMWYLYEDEVGPATNADHIRSMSDEELAEHIWKKFGCPNGKNNVTCGYAGYCKDCWLEWLRQPVQQEDIQ